MHDLSVGITAAIDHFGSQAALATAIGIKRSAVSQWKKYVPIWPTNRVLQIEQASGGAVSRHEMRPDVYGPAPAKRKRAA